MTNKAVIGLQWGDEGKGKIVDFLSEDFDLVTRYQGGNNAGHTVIVEDVTYKLNLIPSGVIRGKFCFLGQGIVLDPEHFMNEFKKISEKINNPQIFLSSNIPLILHYHKQLDKINESILSGESKIGTTAKGIGPAYQDKVGRKSVKLYELENHEYLKDKLYTIKKFYDPILIAFDEKPIDIDETIIILSNFFQEIKNLIVDNNFIKQNFMKKKILFEGAQGALLDLDHGSYPFVTSSNTISSNIVIGSGLQVNYETLGIFKAYATRVGNGPFPSELFDSVGDYIAEKGVEFGTVTKRKRRCGWLDLVSLKYSCEINRVKELCITKVDVLNDLKEIKVCKSYEGKSFNEINFSNSNFLDTCNLVESDYEIFPSWGNLENNDYQNLPENLKNYISYIENYLDIPIKIISLGPERNQTIIK
ncbi:MAG: adenylosuccinate synthase [alpha proteobacterium HIMB59]|nr:MAG: adenylosuccinate synthase [alpha proteobacterium HIMB59]|tara:strand:- start:1832 stop:3085 length:1254 start_codon:yes stop_codon:yes gene_type:complete